MASKAHKNYVGPEDNFFEEKLGEFAQDGIDYQNANSYQAFEGDWTKAFSKRDDSFDRIDQLGSDFNKFSGRNPTEKALSYGKFIENYFQKERGDNKQKMQSALQKLAQVKQGMEEGTVPGEGIGGDNVDRERSPEEVEVSDVDIRALEFLGRLSSLETFDVGGDTRKVRSHKGKVRTEKMKGIDELGRAVMRDLVNVPQLRALDIINHDIRVMNKYEKILVVQDIFLLIDDSGSMHRHYAKVKGILLKFRPAIIKKKVRLHIALFEEKLRRKRSIETVEEFDKVYKGLPSGGGGMTEIHDCVQEAFGFISEKKWDKKKPLPEFDKEIEIVIVNDGNDELHGDPVVKTHCISFDCENDSVKEYCLKSGGTYNQC